MYIFFSSKQSIIILCFFRPLLLPSSLITQQKGGCCAWYVRDGPEQGGGCGASGRHSVGAAAACPTPRLYPESGEEEAVESMLTLMYGPAMG